MQNAFYVCQEPFLHRPAARIHGLSLHKRWSVRSTLEPRIQNLNRIIFPETNMTDAIGTWPFTQRDIAAARTCVATLPHAFYILTVFEFSLKAGRDLNHVFHLSCSICLPQKKAARLASSGPFIATKGTKNTREFNQSFVLFVADPVLRRWRWTSHMFILFSRHREVSFLRRCSLSLINSLISAIGRISIGPSPYLKPGSCETS